VNEYKRKKRGVKPTRETTQEKRKEKMSWRSGYVADGRGGFRRNRPSVNEDGGGGGEDGAAMEESGEVHEGSKQNNNNNNNNTLGNNNNNNNNNGGNQHKSTPPPCNQPSPPHHQQQYGHHSSISSVTSKRNDEQEKNDYNNNNNNNRRNSANQFPDASMSSPQPPLSRHHNNSNDFRGGGGRGYRGGRGGGRFGGGRGGGGGRHRNHSFSSGSGSGSGGGRGNDGSSHYSGRDFRNESHQPPPPPPPPGSRESSNGDASSSGGGSLTDRDVHNSSKNRGISRESSWSSSDGRGGGFRRGSINNNNNRPPPPNEDNGPPPRLQRDTSFGGGPGGPPPSSSHHRNDHNRDGGTGGREPSFIRDGVASRDGHGYNRDGHPHPNTHPKLKGSPVLSFGNHKRDSSFGRGGGGGGDLPPPPPLYLGQEGGSNRDQTSLRGNEDLALSGSTKNVDRIRPPVDRKRDISSSSNSSYQGRAPLRRESPFGQGGGPHTGPHTGGPPPPRGILPRDSGARDPGTGTIHSQGKHPPSAQAGGAAAAAPSRPTDPRRRNSISIGTTTTTTTQGGISTVASDEGSSTSSSINNRNIDRGPLNTSNDVLPPPGAPPSPNPPRRVIPPGAPPSPNPPRRLSSYSSLADSTARPGGSSNNFRSPGGGIRRASSDAGFRNDRTGYHPTASNQSSKPWLERSGSFSSGSKNNNNIKNPIPNHDSHRPSSQQNSNQPNLARNADPRFNRTDNSSINNTGSAHRGDSNKKSESSEPEPERPKQSHSVDPFGRSRDWNQKPRPVRRPSLGDGSRISPTKHKPLKSFQSAHQSPQSKEKTLLSAPKLSMPTSSITNTSNSDNASTSVIDPSTAESAKKIESKPVPLSPLLVSSLGNADVMKRAETVVLNLHEVMSIASSKLEMNGNAKELPSKTDIMAAVQEIEKLTRKTKSEVDETEEETKKATNEEELRRAQEATEVEEEKKQKQLEVEMQKEEQRKEEEHSKSLADKEAQDQIKIRFEEELEKREVDLKDKVTKAKEGKKLQFDQELQTKIAEACTGLDKSIAKSRREMEKSKTAAQKISKKLATAEKSYKAIVETEKKKKQKRKKPTKRDCIPLDDIVNSITLENKRKVKEAHMLAFSFADPHLGLDTYEFNNPLQASSFEERDPKYRKTFEEWSIMAKQVTGLSTRLYSEPSETPYYEQNERNHASVGPLVKEYVRDKQIRLNKHWTMLAEEYEVRKRLYEKHQRKLAKKATRVSITSRKSILGNKESKEKPDDKGTKTIEASGRSSNNPYRRARRGNEVRSEYEQEQIIAEIAAREAMEKRITHGGSKLPRQIVPLERVSTVLLSL
ncbi:MAG: hypothetical protein ACI90V_002571, partial [Bacillariaceae sp.]|jgi:hypothetical protein